VRGIGEIGITGVAGALCNAVYHATRSADHARPAARRVAI